MILCHRVLSYKVLLGVSLAMFYFRACEDLHTVQEFQTLPSLLLIGLKKNLRAVSHGRTHVTNFKILEHQNIIHLLFLDIFVDFSINITIYTGKPSPLVRAAPTGVAAFGING